MHKLVPIEPFFNKDWGLFFLAMFLIMGVGFTKFYFGIQFGRPVGFLFVFLILALIAIFYFLKPQGISKTALGKSFLETSQKRFEWLKEEEKIKSGFNNPDLIYGVALFGLAAFAETSVGILLQDPLSLVNQTAMASPSFWNGWNAGSGYSGSSGCSSSSCSGGSCGGGSCGGGGCGGGCGGCGG